LSFPIIGGADNGNFVPLAGPVRYADGYTWQQVNNNVGGWVAVNFINDGLVNVSWDNGCFQPVAYCNGNNSSVQPIQPVPPIYRPISTPQRGGYTVAVPGSDPSTIFQVQRLVPGAFVDVAREGRFVNAGGFSDYDSARSMSYFLRSQGLNARVIYK
jgi:hypothetical protein